jgi:tRNA uridine 5-carboxymethylaminomethyl modification enzyme
MALPVEARRLAALGLSASGAAKPLGEWVRSLAIDRDVVAGLCPALAGSDGDAIDEALVDARYIPYVEREDGKVAQLRGDLALPLDAALDYGRVPGLSREMVERLAAVRPESVAAAARVRGITPAAVSALLAASRLPRREMADAACST